ncbi:unnamed protein product, partial [Sphacelaria rigidula]
VLANLPDFKHEETTLQHTVESRGHILLLSPKHHPTADFKFWGSTQKWG